MAVDSNKALVRCLGPITVVFLLSLAIFVAVFYFREYKETQLNDLLRNPPSVLDDGYFSKIKSLQNDLLTWGRLDKTRLSFESVSELEFHSSLESVQKMYPGAIIFGAGPINKKTNSISECELIYSSRIGKNEISTALLNAFRSLKGP